MPLYLILLVYLCCMIVSNACCLRMSVRDCCNYIPFICKFKDVISLPMLRPHCSDILLIKALQNTFICIHLTSWWPWWWISTGIKGIHISQAYFTCYVGKYIIIVLKLWLTLDGCGMVMPWCTTFSMNGPVSYVTGLVSLNLQLW